CCGDRGGRRTPRRGARDRGLRRPATRRGRMSIAECIAKLVSAGRISKEIAAEASALYERSKGEFAEHMGPAQAEAAAGLAAARAMEAGAKKLKTDAAKQALGWANFE